MIHYIKTDQNGKIFSYGTAMSESEIPDYDMDENSILHLVENPGGATHYIDGVFSTQEDLEKLATLAIEMRNHALMMTDWTQLADNNLDKTAWAEYRQALRDITDQPGFPGNIVWPEPPAHQKIT